MATINTKNLRCLQSVDVEVFPAGFRGEEFGASKLTTEKNISKNLILSSESDNNDLFFLDPDDTNYGIIKLHGYRFRILINSIKEITNEFKNVYCFIKLKNLSTVSDLGSGNMDQVGKVLSRVDDSSSTTLDDDVTTKFFGLGFIDVKPESSDSDIYYSLQIKKDNNLIFQKIKFSENEIRTERGKSDTLDRRVKTNLLEVSTIRKSGSGNINIPNSLTTQDEKTISIKDNVTINKPLTINSDVVIGSSNGPVEIKSSGSNKTTIIGPNNGVINLPANGGSENVVLVQNSNVPGWVTYSKHTSLLNSIVQRNNSDIETVTLNGLTLKIGAGDNSDAILISNGKEGLTQKSLLIDSKAEISQNGSLLIRKESASSDDYSVNISGTKSFISSADVNIQSDLNIKSGANVTFDTTKITLGSYNINFAGSISLPADSTTTKSVLTQVSPRDSQWVRYSDYSSSSDLPENSIVQRSGKNIKSANILLSDLKSSSGLGLKISGDSSFGKLEAVDLSKSDPGVSDAYTTDFISSVSQASDGIITATKKHISLAGTNQAGIIKAVTSNSAASDITSPTTGDDGSKYKLQTTTDNLGFIYIPKIVVDTSGIAAGAVTDKKIASKSVGTDQLKDLSVSEAKISDSAVTSGKIGADAVTNAKLADNAVQSENIKDSAIITAKINNKAVTKDKLANDSVGNAQLCSSSVGTDELQANAVTNAKLADDAVTKDKISGKVLKIGSSDYYLGDTALSLSGLTSVTATSFTASSDIRLKENISDFKLSKSILDLPIKRFDFKGDNSPKNQIGCIAQDLQKIYPELVVKGDDGFLSINESKLVYILIEEVKLLKEELENLKKGV